MGIKRMLEIVEQVDDSSDEKTEIYFQKRPELISLIKEINYKYQFLAVQYDHLADELHGKVSPALQTQKPSSAVFHTCRDNPFITPDLKLGVHKIEPQAIAFDFSLSSGSSSSNVSAKEDSESSLPPSSDSDTESCNSSPYNDSNSKSRISGEASSKLDTAHDTSMVRDNLEYDGQLRILKEKLRLSEVEISRLKSENEIKTSVAMSNLKAELERAIAEVKVRDEDLELEKRKVSELQMQLVGLETTVVDYGFKIETLMKELKLTSVKLDISEGELANLKQEISKEISQLQSDLELSKQDSTSLKANLASEKMQVQELQERITRYAGDVSDRDCKIKKLTAALQEALRNSESEKAQFQSHNCSLLEKLTLLEARCAESEDQIELLEIEIKKSQASNVEMEARYEAHEIIWQDDIEELKALLNDKDARLESINKSFDELKLKYDMLMAEKDWLIAKLQTLNAELCSRDIRIQQLEAEMDQLKLQHAETTNVSECAFKLTNELRMKVESLENEVERQASIISDRAEEKREAIRQLCLSLDHYRSGYQELREAYIGQRRRSIIAS